MLTMEWINMTESVIALVTGFIGLLGTLIGAIFAIKNFMSVLKEKNGAQIWALIMEMADAAMKEAEKSNKKGADKKQMVIDAVKAGCEAADIDVSKFIDQLVTYIDSTIDFVNKMCK